MARRRITGSIIINPKRKKAPRKARKNPRKGTARSARTRSRRVKAAGTRRRKVRANPAPRRLRRRLPARAALPRRVRRVRRGMGLRRPLPPRKIMRRRLPGMFRRRGVVRVRRNPGIVSGAQGMLRRIPVFGKFLANVVGFAPHSLLGAISVEPVNMLAKLVARWMPDMNASLFYALVGGVAATAVGYLPIPPEIRSKLQVAIAAGSGAIAYDKWRSAGANSGPMESETLEDVAASNEGNVAGLIGLGEPGITDVGDVVTMGDIYYSGPDFSGAELGAARKGAMAWRRLRSQRIRRMDMPHRQPGVEPGAKSEYEAQQWDWLVQIIGPAGLDRLARLDPATRVRTIHAMKQEALQTFQQATGYPGGTGTLVYAS